MFAHSSSWKWSDERVSRQVRTLTGHTDVVFSVAVNTSSSPLANLIVSGSEDHLVKIWDFDTGAEVIIFVQVR